MSKPSMDLMQFLSKSNGIFKVEKNNTEMYEESQKNLYMQCDHEKEQQNWRCHIP